MTVIDAPQRIKLAEMVLSRFIYLVWVSIGLLIITGTALAVPRITSFRTFLSSTYGNVLFLKLLIVLIMSINVFIIWYFLFPRFKSLAPSPEQNRVMGQIVAAVKINLTLGLLVFFMAELLSIV